MDTWQQRSRPNRLERKFIFESYDSTREFLDRLGEHSQAVNRFPDISFGTTYVNITIRPESEDEKTPLTKDDHRFAEEIDGLLD